MSVLIENEHNYQFDFDYEKTAKEVALTTLAMEECPYETEINIDLVDDEEIRDINKEFRDIDSPTDVLSFPMLEFPKPANYDILESDDAPYFNPDSGELLLGDIVISIPAVMRQAKEYEHGIKREYAFLLTHSMLHLLGYDHLEPQEAKAMDEKQEEVLTKLQITR